jgi:hypothetical protein
MEMGADFGLDTSCEDFMVASKFLDIGKITIIIVYIVESA